MKQLTFNVYNKTIEPVEVDWFQNAYSGIGVPSTIYKTCEKPTLTMS
ncbi:hypothetical protein [uncultured Cocleimonas sp.]|nr:hypothetical protein [uncultured Cocleimonas sp.]